MTDLLEVYYFKTTDLWRHLCTEHQQLFNLTVDEYAALLQSNIEQVEVLSEEKNGIIERIKGLDFERSKIMLEINSAFNTNISNAHQLLIFFQDFATEKQHSHLYRFNEFLIDIINELKEQNKKNQIFINKAINAITEIKHTAMGVKNFKVYDSKGYTTVGSPK